MMQGWVEIVPRWDGTAQWAVLDWSEHFDSGALVGTYSRRSTAHSEAQSFARQNGRKMRTAEIIAFPGSQEGGS